MTPNDLAELRAALIERCQLDSAPPSDASLNADLNEAIARFDMAMPQGWPWDFLEGGAVGMAPLIPSSPDPYVWALSDVVSKIRYVLLASIDGLWKYPLERVTRLEQLERYPDDLLRGTPRTYALGAADGPDEPKMAVFFRPLPDVDYELLIGGIAPVPIITSDVAPAANPNDYQLEDWSTPVIEYAAALTYRANGNISEAVAASAAFDAMVLEQRRWARREYGAGVGSRAVAQDPSLP